MAGSSVLEALGAVDGLFVALDLHGVGKQCGQCMYVRRHRFGDYVFYLIISRPSGGFVARDGACGAILDSTDGPGWILLRADHGHCMV